MLRNSSPSTPLPSEEAAHHPEGSANGTETNGTHGVPAGVTTAPASAVTNGTTYNGANSRHNGAEQPELAASVGLPRSASLLPPAPMPVKKRRRFKRPSNKVIGAVLVASLLAWYVAKRRAASNVVVPPTVETAKAEIGEAMQTVSATGTLKAFTTVDVKSRAGGTVIKMAVEEGTRVKAGQLICLIDRQDTSAAYKQAVSDLNSAKAALRQAQETARLQRETTGPQIDQSAQGVASAQAQLKQARENLSLQSETLGPNIRSAQEAVTSARVKLQQAQQALSLQRQISETDIAQARGGVAAAQANLESAQESAKAQPALSTAAISQGEASVASAQAQLESAQQSLQLLQGATQPQETASVQAQVDQATSDLATAQANLLRQQGLLAKGFVAQNTVDTAKNSVITARSSLRTAQAKLDTLKDQQSTQVRSAQAAVASARGQISQAQAGLNTARTNTVQNSLKDKAVTAALAALRQAQATYNAALSNRRQIAVKQGDVTASQAAVRQAQAALTTAQANSRQVGVRAADVQASQAAVRQAEAALRSTQANTIQNNIKGEDVARAQASVTRAQAVADDARTNLAQTRVVASRDGVVLQKYVDEGTIIQSGQSGFTGGTSIVQLANTSRMFVDAQVDEADVATVKAGQKVTITLDAYPNDKKMGTVRKVYPLAVTETNVTYIHVQVEIDPKYVNATLRPAMNATCDFLVQDQKGVLVVPSEAIKDDRDSTVVTRVKDPSKPLYEASNQETRKVVVGVRGDEDTQIVSGLKKDDVIITKITDNAAEGGSGPGSGSGGGSGGGGRRGGMGMMGGRPR